MPRQAQTYNRQNWAYKIIALALGASRGTGGIFATCNVKPVAVLPGNAGLQGPGSDSRMAIPITLVRWLRFRPDRVATAAIRAPAREKRAGLPIPLTEDPLARIYSAS